MNVKMTEDLSALVEAAAFDQINKGLKKIAMTAERHAKLACPVDTGRLRNSISNTNDKNTAYIGTNVEYAPYVEMGTSRMKAQPYLKPAIEEHLAEYKAILEQELKT